LFIFCPFGAKNKQIPIIMSREIKNMTGKLAGKVALITGASAGIGRASALALAQEGASLVLTARRTERLEELKAAVEQAGGKAVFVVGDAVQEEIAQQCVAAAMDTFGRLDILINNVGVGNYKNLVDTSLAEYDEMVDTNVRSTFLFTRYTVPVMLKQGSGTILMISSMAGLYGFAGEAVYCATKFAQVGFAQALDKNSARKGSRLGSFVRVASRRNLLWGRAARSSAWLSLAC
jgi:3-oxoacyl-[acyl-carrier protein] reductase